MKTFEFVNQLRDSDLMQKMAAVQSPAEAYELAKASGVTDSFDEFMTEMEKFKSSVGELSEDDLAAVAGGMTEVEQTVIISGTVSISVGTTVAATAAV